MEKSCDVVLSYLCGGALYWGIAEAFVVVLRLEFGSCLFIESTTICISSSKLVSLLPNQYIFQGCLDSLVALGT